MKNKIKIKDLNILINGQHVGELYKDSNYNLRYVKGIENNSNFIDGNLSKLSFAINYTQNKLYRTQNLKEFSFLTSSMPEGFLLELLLEKYKQDSTYTPYKIDDMFLLALLGNKQIGRLSIISDDEKFNQFLNEREEKKLNSYSLQDILNNKSDDVFRTLLNDYLDHFSLFQRNQGDFTMLSGFQPKISTNLVDKTNFNGKDYIIKTFNSKAFNDLSLNEYICMSIAKEAGLDVPPFYLSEDQKLFVVERFDKDYGMEDFCSVRNFSSDKKYNSHYENCAKVVLNFCPHDIDKFFSSLCLSALVKNGDAHLKNFSLLYHDISDIHFSPVYDVVNTSIYPMFQDQFGKVHFDSFAMPLYKGKSKDFPLESELRKFGLESCGLKKQEVDEILFKIQTAKEKVMKENRDLFHNQDFYKMFCQSLNLEQSFIC